MKSTDRHWEEYGRDNPTASPTIEMNPYDLNKIFLCLQRHGITQMHAEFTDHGGLLGVVLFFRKP